MAKQKEPEKKKSIGDYMKTAVIEKAKKDAVAMIKRIQNL